MFLKNMMNYIWDGGRQSKSLESKNNYSQSTNFLKLPQTKPFNIKTSNSSQKMNQFSFMNKQQKQPTKVINNQKRQEFNFMLQQPVNPAKQNRMNQNRVVNDKFFMKDEKEIKQMKMEKQEQQKMRADEQKEREYQNRMFMKRQQRNNYFEDESMVDQQEQDISQMSQNIMSSDQDVMQFKQSSNKQVSHQEQSQPKSIESLNRNQSVEGDDEEEQDIQILNFMKDKLTRDRVLKQKQEQKKEVDLMERDETNEDFIKCTQQEIKERQESYQLDIFEQDPNYTQKVAYNFYCIKKYKRPVPNEETVPAFPLNRLSNMMEYIIDNIIDYDKEECRKYTFKKSVQNPIMVDIYNFVSDRFRSIYKDITINKLKGNNEQVWILERISRFMVLSINEMRDYEQYDFFRNSTKLTEYLANLIENYKFSSNRTNQIEFIGYNLILLIKQPLQLYSLLVDYQQNHYERIIQNEHTQKILDILKCIQMNNYYQYFDIIRTTDDYLLSCCMSYYLKHMRIEAIKSIPKIKNITLAEIRDFLLFDDNQQLVQFLQAYGINIQDEDDDYLIQKWEICDPDEQFQRLKTYKEPKSTFIEQKKQQMTRKDIVNQQVKQSQQSEQSQSEEGLIQDKFIKFSHSKQSNEQENYLSKSQSQQQSQLSQSQSQQIQSQEEKLSEKVTSQKVQSDKQSIDQNVIQKPNQLFQVSEKKNTIKINFNDVNGQDNDNLFKPSQNVEFLFNQQKKVDTPQPIFNESEISLKDNNTIENNIAFDSHSDKQQDKQILNQQINDLLDKTIKSSQDKISVAKSSKKYIDRSRIKKFILKQKFDKLKNYYQKTKEKQQKKEKQTLNVNLSQVYKSQFSIKSIKIDKVHNSVEQLLKQMKSFKVMILVNSIEKEYDYFVFYLLKLLTNNRVKKDCFSELPQVYNQFTDREIKLNIQLFYQKPKKMVEKNTQCSISLNEYQKKVSHKHLFGTDKIMFILTQNIELDKQRLQQFIEQVQNLKEKYDIILESEIKVEMIFIQIKNQFKLEQSHSHQQLVEQLELKKYQEIINLYEFIDYDYYNQYSTNTIYDMDCRKNIFENKMCSLLQKYNKSNSYQCGFNVINLRQVFEEIYMIYCQMGSKDMDKYSYRFHKELFESILMNIINGVISVYQNQNQIVYQFIQKQDLENYREFLKNFSQIIQILQDCLLEDLDNYLEDEQNQINSFDQWKQCNYKEILKAFDYQFMKFRNYQSIDYRQQIETLIADNLRFYQGRIKGKWFQIIGLMIQIMILVIPKLYIFIKDDLEFKIDIDQIYQNSSKKKEVKRKKVSLVSYLTTSKKVQNMDFVSKTFKRSSIQDVSKSESTHSDRSVKEQIHFFDDLEFQDKLLKKIKE